MTYVPPGLCPDGSQFIDGETRYLGYSILCYDLVTKFVGNVTVGRHSFQRHDLFLDGEIRRQGQPIAKLRQMAGGDPPEIQWSSAAHQDLFSEAATNWVEAFEWRGELWRDGKLPDTLDPRLYGQRAFESGPTQHVDDLEDDLDSATSREARFLACLAKSAVQESVTSNLSAFVFDRTENRTE